MATTDAHWMPKRGDVIFAHIDGLYRPAQVVQFMRDEPSGDDDANNAAATTTAAATGAGKLYVNLFDADTLGNGGARQRSVNFDPERNNRSQFPTLPISEDHMTAPRFGGHPANVTAMKRLNALIGPLSATKRAAIFAQSLRPEQREVALARARQQLQQQQQAQAGATTATTTAATDGSPTAGDRRHRSPQHEQQQVPARPPQSNDNSAPQPNKPSSIVSPAKTAATTTKPAHHSNAFNSDATSHPLVPSFNRYRPVAFAAASEMPSNAALELVLKNSTSMVRDETLLAALTATLGWENERWPLFQCIASGPLRHEPAAHISRRGVAGQFLHSAFSSSSSNSSSNNNNNADEQLLLNPEASSLDWFSAKFFGIPSARKQQQQQQRRDYNNANTMDEDDDDDHRAQNEAEEEDLIPLAQQPVKSPEELARLVPLQSVNEVNNNSSTGSTSSSDAALKIRGLLLLAPFLALRPATTSAFPALFLQHIAPRLTSSSSLELFFQHDSDHTEVARDFFLIVTGLCSAAARTASSRSSSTATTATATKEDACLLAQFSRPAILLLALLVIDVARMHASHALSKTEHGDALRAQIDASRFLYSSSGAAAAPADPGLPPRVELMLSAAEAVGACFALFHLVAAAAKATGSTVDLALAELNDFARNELALPPAAERPTTLLSNNNGITSRAQLWDTPIVVSTPLAHSPPQPTATSSSLQGTTSDTDDKFAFFSQAAIFTSNLLLVSWCFDSHVDAKNSIESNAPIDVVAAMFLANELEARLGWRPPAPPASNLDAIAQHNDLSCWTIQLDCLQGVISLVKNRGSQLGAAVSLARTCFLVLNFGLVAGHRFPELSLGGRNSSSASTAAAIATTAFGGLSSTMMMNSGSNNTNPLIPYLSHFGRALAQKLADLLKMFSKQSFTRIKGLPVTLTLSWFAQLSILGSAVLCRTALCDIVARLPLKFHARLFPGVVAELRARIRSLNTAAAAASTTTAAGLNATATSALLSSKLSSLLSQDAPLVPPHQVPWRLSPAWDCLDSLLSDSRLAAARPGVVCSWVLLDVVRSVPPGLLARCFPDMANDPVPRHIASHLQRAMNAVCASVVFTNPAIAGAAKELNGGAQAAAAAVAAAVFAVNRINQRSSNTGEARFFFVDPLSDRCEDAFHALLYLSNGNGGSPLHQMFGVPRLVDRQHLQQQYPQQFSDVVKTRAARFALRHIVAYQLNNSSNSSNGTVMDDPLAGHFADALSTALQHLFVDAGVAHLPPTFTAAAAIQHDAEVVAAARSAESVVLSLLAVLPSITQVPVRETILRSCAAAVPPSRNVFAALLERASTLVSPSAFVQALAHHSAAWRGTAPPQNVPAATSSNDGTNNNSTVPNPIYVKLQRAISQLPAADREALARACDEIIPSFEDGGLPGQRCLWLAQNVRNVSGTAGGNRFLGGGGGASGSAAAMAGSASGGGLQANSAKNLLQQQQQQQQAARPVAQDQAAALNNHNNNNGDDVSTQQAFDDFNSGFAMFEDGLPQRKPQKRQLTLAQSMATSGVNFNNRAGAAAVPPAAAAPVMKQRPAPPVAPRNNAPIDVDELVSDKSTLSFATAGVKVNATAASPRGGDNVTNILGANNVTGIDAATARGVLNINTGRNQPQQQPQQQPAPPRINITPTNQHHQQQQLQNLANQHQQQLDLVTANLQDEQRRYERQQFIESLNSQRNKIEEALVRSAMKVSISEASRSGKERTKQTNIESDDAAGLFGELFASASLAMKDVTDLRQEFKFQPSADGRVETANPLKYALCLGLSLITEARAQLTRTLVELHAGRISAAAAAAANKNNNNNNPQHQQQELLLRRQNAQQQSDLLATNEAFTSFTVNLVGNVNMNRFGGFTVSLQLASDFEQRTAGGNNSSGNNPPLSAQLNDYDVLLLKFLVERSSFGNSVGPTQQTQVGDNSNQGNSNNNNLIEQEIVCIVRASAGPGMDAYTKGGAALQQRQQNVQNGVRAVDVVLQKNTTVEQILLNFPRRPASNNNNNAGAAPVDFPARGKVLAVKLASLSSVVQQIAAVHEIPKTHFWGIVSGNATEQDRYDKQSTVPPNILPRLTQQMSSTLERALTVAELNLNEMQRRSMTAVFGDGFAPYQFNNCNSSNNNIDGTTENLFHPTQPLLFLSGPPGTGKTAVIVAMVLRWVLTARMIRRDSNGQYRKPAPVLVCAPSNAAVDEVMNRLYSKRKIVEALRRNRNNVNAATNEVSGEDTVASSALKLVRVGVRESVHEDVIAANLFLDDLAEKMVNESRAIAGQQQQQQRRGGMNNNNNNNNNYYAPPPQQQRLTFMDARREVISNADVVCSTLGSLRTWLPKDFAFVIVDEASQAVEPAALVPLALLGAQRAVLIGDAKQLRPVVISRDQYLSRSLMERIVDGSDIRSRAMLMLRRQYRMHPHIAQFPNTNFYRSLLENAPEIMDAQRRRHRLLADLLDGRGMPHLLFLDVKGTEATSAGGSTANPDESRVVVELLAGIARMVGAERFPAAVRTITFYQAQKKLIRTGTPAQLKANGGAQVHTVDSFQGQEAPAIILSLVRSAKRKSGGGVGQHGVGFLDDDNRLNVALTRAQELLLIVGDADHVSQHCATLGNLVRHCRNTPGAFWDSARVQAAMQRAMTAPGNGISLEPNPM